MKNFVRLFKTSIGRFWEVSGFIHQVIIGTLLGHSSAERRNSNSNTRLVIKITALKFDYFLHLFNCLCYFCGAGPFYGEVAPTELFPIIAGYVRFNTFA